MKKNSTQQTHRLNYRHVLGMFVGLVILGSFFYACKQEHQSDLRVDNPNSPLLKTESSQPLPGGRANFSVVNGNFDLSGYTWERVVDWTFNGTAGTVAATSWTWESDIKTGHTDFQTYHRCTFLGHSNPSGTTHTPTGWVYPAGGYVNWAGTYTFNTTTNQLTINWTSPALMAGNSEVWTVSSPSTTLSKVTLVSSTYTLTHGVGYGSNAAWTSYKTMVQIPRVNYSGHSITVNGANGTSASTISATGFNTWHSAALQLSLFTSPSSPSPYNCLHSKQPTTKCKASSCNTPAYADSGIIYHLASHDNSRQMVYNNWCSCLITSPNWPDYFGNLHPSAFMQIIDDNGDLKGYVGIEAQNPPNVAGIGGYPAYQFTLWDFVTP